LKRVDAPRGLETVEPRSARNPAAIERDARAEDDPRPPRARLAVTAVLGVAPLAAGWFADTGVDRFGGMSVLALCAIPWVFLTSMPRGIGARAPFGHEVAALALALPTFAAAAGLDLAQGASAWRTIFLAAAALVAMLVLGDAARRAATSTRAATVHAITWFVLVSGPCVLVYALQVGGGLSFGSAPDSVRFLAGGSPLGMLLANTQDVAAPPWISPILATMHAAVLASVAFAASFRTRAEERA